MTNNIIDADAKEFGVHVNSGGWRLGLLVARNVTKGEGQGRRAEEGQLCNGQSKVSSRQFARDSKTSDVRVLRYFDAWEQAADAGLVPHAADLSPGQDVVLPEAEAWRPYLDERGRNIKEPDRRELIEAQARADRVGPSKTLDIASNPSAMRAAIKADASTASAAAEALAATPAGRVTAQKALDKAHEGHERVPRATPDAYAADRYDLVASMRKMQRAGGELLDAVPKVQNDLTSVERDALVSFVTWVRNYAEALDVVVRNEPIDVQLAAFLSEGGV